DQEIDIVGCSKEFVLRPRIQSREIDDGADAVPDVGTEAVRVFRTWQDASKGDNGDRHLAGLAALDRRRDRSGACRRGLGRWLRWQRRLRRLATPIENVACDLFDRAVQRNLRWRACQCPDTVVARKVPPDQLRDHLTRPALHESSIAALIKLTCNPGE